MVDDLAPRLQRFLGDAFTTEVGQMRSKSITRTRSTTMRCGRFVRVIAIILAIFVVPDVEAQTMPAARRDSILSAVRSYVDANNRVDVQAMVDAYSKSPGVSAAALGDIRRGWEAIRMQADSAAGMEGQFKLSLGAIDVMPLGASHALVVSSASMRVESGDGPAQFNGALTLVVERVGGAWKILHEHLSLPLPEG